MVEDAGQLADVVIGERGGSCESGFGEQGSGIDAVEKQAVKVDIQPEAAVEPLYEHDRARVSIGDAVHASSAMEEGQDRADEDAANPGAQLGIVYQTSVRSTRTFSSPRYTSSAACRPVSSYRPSTKTYCSTTRSSGTTIQYSGTPVRS